VFPLYAFAYLVLAYKVLHRRTQGGFRAPDGQLVGHHRVLRGGFAAYVGFLFLTTVDGVCASASLLFLATPSRFSHGLNLAASPTGRVPLFGARSSSSDCKYVNASNLLGGLRARTAFAEKIEEVSRLAWQDQLTKLPNSLTSVNVWRRCSPRGEERTQVALLLFDIDGFKSVNDTLGTSGDRLLQRSPSAWTPVRQADTFARVGGDEFVILMELAMASPMQLPLPKRFWRRSQRSTCSPNTAAVGASSACLQRLASAGNDSPTNCS